MSTLEQEVCSLKLHFKKYENVHSDKSTPLILLHGWANSLEVISPLAEKLQQYKTVYSIDLPGHGKSEVPKQVWDMKCFSDILKRFLDEHSISQAVFVGHSFGGKTIIKFTDAYPEYVSKIVLIGASGIRPKASLRKKIYFTYLRFLRNFLRFKNTGVGQKIYENWYIPRYASRDYKSAGPMTKTFVKTLNEELHAELSRLKKPALLIWGSDDEESPPEVGQKMHQLIAGSTFIIMEGQGHHPFSGSGLPLLTKYIRDFL